MSNSRLFGFWLICLSFAFIACDKKSDDELSKKNKVVLKVNAGVKEFDNGDLTKSLKATTFNQYSGSNESIDTSIVLNKDFILHAQIIPDTDKALAAGASSIKRADNRADNKDISANVWYKLVVYNTNTKAFVEERTYQRGNEGATEKLELDGGVNYTFVAYSVNTSEREHLDALAGSFADKSLDDHAVRVSDDKDLLFFQRTMTVSGETNDALNIEFKRKFNQITLSIDASAVNSDIKEVTAKLTTNAGTAMMDKDGTITRTGTPKGSPFVFPSLGTTEVTSSPIVVNVDPNNWKLSISRLTVGNKTSGSEANPLLPALSKILESGKKYTIKLAIKPSQTPPDIIIGTPTVEELKVEIKEKELMF